MTARTAGRRAGAAATTAAVAVAAVAGGWAAGSLVGPEAHSRMFPWIMARATGIGAFLVLGLMVVVGLWFRRPARPGSRQHRETLLHLHSALVPALLALIGAHVWALLADRYAGVAPVTLVEPGTSHYRPGPVALGVVATWLLAVIVATAALAGRPVVRHRWAGAHKLAYPAFALVWLHGVLAGSDTPALRWMYVAVGLAVGLSAAPAATRARRRGVAGVTAS